MKAAYLRVLEGFEDGDGVIRNVKSEDIAEMLAVDGPAAALAQELNSFVALCEPRDMFPNLCKAAKAALAKAGLPFMQP